MQQTLPIPWNLFLESNFELSTNRHAVFQGSYAEDGGKCIENLCMQILQFKPGLVITEKGLSDLVCRYLSKAGVSAIRTLRMTDNNRIAEARGAVIVNRRGELQESDVGMHAGLLKLRRLAASSFHLLWIAKIQKPVQSFYEVLARIF